MKALSTCSTPGCPLDAVSRGRCATHAPKAWASSNRRRELPRNWAAIRERILARDAYTCTRLVDGVRCNTPATDVDHVHDRHDHSEGNLTSLCAPHHREKTLAEATAGRKARPR